jgi:hypothetical protein
MTRSSRAAIHYNIIMNWPMAIESRFVGKKCFDFTTRPLLHRMHVLWHEAKGLVTFPHAEQRSVSSLSTVLNR